MTPEKIEVLKSIQQQIADRARFYNEEHGQESQELKEFCLYDLQQAINGYAEQQKLIEQLVELLIYANCVNVGPQHIFARCKWCLAKEKALAAAKEIK